METYVISGQLAEKFRQFLEAEAISSIVIHEATQLPGFKNFGIVPKIKQAVSAEYGVPAAKLDAKDNHSVLIFPRYVAMYLTRKLTGASFPKVGAMFGGKHHSSVMYGIEKVTDMIATDEDVRHEIEKLERELSL
jgi:chromosomal replication initiation ATPase DnaA